VSDAGPVFLEAFSFSEEAFGKRRPERGVPDERRSAGSFSALSDVRQSPRSFSAMHHGLGSGRVRDYRVYYLDEGGRVVRRETLRCESDDKALALLEAPRKEPVVELWDLGRLVKRLDGEGS
jgi:hypothetical protein